MIKLVINVPDQEAAEIRKFVSDMGRKGKPGKGIPCIELKVNNCATVSTLKCRYTNLDVEGLPEPKFKVGDVVENESSGHWGKVLSVDDGAVVVTASKETAKEIGHKTFTCNAQYLELLI